MENNSKTYLLITTAIEETWGHSGQKAVLLGEWCKTMKNEDFLQSKNYEQISYHWADREKFIKDYEYLELFYERVLESLSESLNQHHQTQHSLRYWRILLGPWLLTYVATAWDRWESLRLAFDKQDSYTIFTLDQKHENCIPEDFNAYKEYYSIDEWNEHLFLEIIKYKYSHQVSINSIIQADNSSIKKNFIIEQKEPTKSKLIRFIDSCFALIQNNYKVVFVEPYFDRKSLLSLSFRLKQLPRRHYEFFQTVDYPSVNQERYSRNIDIQTTNDFEEFFQQHIFSQIPIAYLEGFQELNRVASSIKTNGDIIFTANAHLDNDLFNCWTGSQVEAGKRLVVSQHGGAIRSNFTNFDHQEKIADAMTVWHKPYMSNQVQLTPNKMIRMKRIVKKNKDKLTLVGFETPRYTHRAQASPTADTYMEDYDQKIAFANALNHDIYDDLTVRCFNYDHGGTSSKDRYIRDLGIEKLGTEKTIQDAFSHSKLVVCTYPQTTFSEAMHSNIPTILLFCEEHWPLHPQFDDLIEQLKRNKIIFTDPLEAAEHINQVWDNPDEWWLDPSTRRAVEYFFEMCGTVGDDWTGEWIDFFQKELKKSKHISFPHVLPWHYSKGNILATTAIEETWGHSGQKAVLLGEWCKTMKNEDFLQSKNYEQISYHWADREKFIKDYEYLELFYERVLESLSESLNQHHQTQHSLRYWRILLGPWLLTYVAVVWDRWESLRLAFDSSNLDELQSLKLNQDHLIPQDYYKFDTIWTDDLWNHHLFSEIIHYQYAKQIKIRYLDYGQDYDVNLKPSSKMKRSTKSILLRLIDSCLGFLQKNYKVVFVEPYFNISALTKICFKLVQLPRFHYEFFQTVDYPSVNQERFSRNIDIQTTNDFEEFFQQHIFSQIPIAYLEGFQELNRVASSIKTNGDIIFTANAHMDNDLFNCWTGSQVEAGKRLVVSQHGGAIRSRYQFFDHQEKIADAMTVWHKPYMSNQVQLTPNKIISGLRHTIFDLIIKNPSKNLTLVGFETSRYSFRAQAGPFAKNYSDDYDQKIAFTNALNQDITDHLSIRSYNRGNGWTCSRDRYSRDLGQNKISKYSTINQDFSHSKLVVCTYPQTTFSEAMHSNIPTILLFCEEHWPLHPQFDDLIEQLKRNKIIFTDPLEAAEHINQVWDNPDEWWLDPSTRRAVEYFFEMCGTVSDNWVEEWVSFFRSENTYLSNDEKDIIKHDYGIDLYTRIRLIFMNSIKKFIQLFLPLFRTKIGRVILEMVATDMIAHTRSISHNDTVLSFVEINRLTKFRIDTFSTKEPETLNWIDHFDKDKVFWDIGANVGLYTCYAAKKNRCITAAFEPSVFNLELLARNISINNLNDLVTIIPLPLTEIIKTSNMNMSDTAQGHALSTFGENYGSDGKPLSSSFAYQMIGLSMDDAVNIFKLPAPNYIKIDVDGIEHLILKGGEGVLNNAESILIEINDAFIEQSEASNKYLTNSGFILKEKKHAEYYDNIKLYSGIEKTTYNQIWIKKN